MNRRKDKLQEDYAAAFLGVAFFGVAFAFFGAAFLGAAVFEVVLVTRPDLVLPRTAGLLTTAGSCRRLDAS
jgi:hypothetical protein